MELAFRHSGLDLRELAAFAAPVRPSAVPEAPPIPAKASEWAKTMLNFEPSAKQAEVLDIDAKYMILCCNRQWGKTTAIALKALHRALTIQDQSIVIISRTKLQAGILIDRACTFAARLGFKIRRVLGHQFSLKLPNGSQIFAVAHTDDTSVGNTANVLIVDEAALVKDEVFFSVSPFAGRTHGAIWHDDDKRWHKVFSTVKDCPEMDPEFLEMQQRADPIKYRQDFLCEFIQPANRLISRETLRKMIDPTLRPNLGNPLVP